jgi:hypothetical protein
VIDPLCPSRRTAGFGIMDIMDHEGALGCRKTKSSLAQPIDVGACCVKSSRSV